MGIISYIVIKNITIIYKNKKLMEEVKEGEESQEKKPIDISKAELDTLE